MPTQSSVFKSVSRRIHRSLFLTLTTLLCASTDLQLEQEDQGGVSPPAIWPSRDGSIEVEGLTASYSPDLPPVLKNVSFKVLPREKIGICGRTGKQALLRRDFEGQRLTHSAFAGSGKSTLGLSFFRFIEPIAGRIVIDGQDINKLKLADLRSRLTIVAQESALFAGTLRFNLGEINGVAQPFTACS